MDSRIPLERTLPYREGPSMGHASIRRIDNNKKLKGLLSPIGIYPLTPYKLIHPIGITPPRDTHSPIGIASLPHSIRGRSRHGNSQAGKTPPSHLSVERAPRPSLLGGLPSPRPPHGLSYLGWIAHLTGCLFMSPSPPHGFSFRGMIDRSRVVLSGWVFRSRSV